MMETCYPWYNHYFVTTVLYCFLRKSPVPGFQPLKRNKIPKLWLFANIPNPKCSNNCQVDSLSFWLQDVSLWWSFFSSIFHRPFANFVVFIDLFVIFIVFPNFNYKFPNFSRPWKNLQNSQVWFVWWLFLCGCVHHSIGLWPLPIKLKSIDC